jgi:hypothetical protein
VTCLNDVKSAFEQLRKNASNMTDGMMAMSSLVVSNTILFLGFDSSRNIRNLLINIGETKWDDEQMRALPRWKGAIVRMEYKEKIGPLTNQYFLTITQGDEEFGDLFETIIQNLVDYLTLSESEELFTTVYKVFERWKSFFKRGGYKKLTEDQQRGLFGELYLINKWTELNPGKPPLLIDSWYGPTKGRIDFLAQRSGIEIKTSIDRLSKTVRISNEKQLQTTDAVNVIYLYVTFLEISNTHGTTLDEIVELLRNKLSAYSLSLLLKFNEMLHELGYKSGEYAEIKLNVTEEEVYQINEGFPRVKASSLPKGINNVSYNIDLSHCESFKVDIDKIYTLI